jgi:hypothetical protein
VDDALALLEPLINVDVAHDRRGRQLLGTSWMVCAPA